MMRGREITQMPTNFQYPIPDKTLPCSRLATARCISLIFAVVAKIIHICAAISSSIEVPQLKQDVYCVMLLKYLRYFYRYFVCHVAFKLDARIF